VFTEVHFYSNSLFNGIKNLKRACAGPAKKKNWNWLVETMKKVMRALPTISQHSHSVKA